mgnify:CR=1 FL=1
MPSFVQDILENAVRMAEQRSNRETAAVAVIGGLRHIRSIAQEQGGPVMAATIDTAIQEILVAQALHIRGATLRPPVFVPLPEARINHPTAVATLILEETVEVCLTYNAQTPDNSVLIHTLRVLLILLEDLLGGLVEWSVLVNAIHHPACSGQAEISGTRMLEGYLIN